jgi:hypothetical protein
MFTLEKYEREADVNVWAFDYNVLFVRDYFSRLAPAEVAPSCRHQPCGGRRLVNS